MFKKILIANRGEIAVRIIKTCKMLNIKTVTIYSKEDQNSLHAYLADEAICLKKSINPYLNIDEIIQIAKITKTNAIHPGYGFLSENYKFVNKLNENNITFIGPPSNILKLFGNKINALQIAKKYKINVLPVYKCEQNINNNYTLAKKIGYPVIIKSILGGGGKGIKIAHTANDLNKAIFLAKKESTIALKNNTLYIEKYLKSSRHIELQIISDGKNIIFLGERECSIQQNYQKIIEETPINNINKNELSKIKKKCKTLLQKIKYSNVGTIEFLYKDNKFYFIEINPRIQVEHTITEKTKNIDLVNLQIKLAYKNKLKITVMQYSAE